MKLLKKSLLMLTLLCLTVFNLTFTSNSSISKEEMDLNQLSLSVPSVAATWYWKLSVYTDHPDCAAGEVWARCGLPGNECSSVMNPGCF